MEPLDPRIPRDLALGNAHPHDPGAGAGQSVEVLQTHLSWVFLTRSRVYKLRKSVRLGFVDFGGRAERNADCLREVELNRRLAPDVYLGVAPVEPDPEGFRVGDIRETLASDTAEHCVVMRRLPAGRDALSLLEADALGPEQLDAVARLLARFHAQHGLGRPAPISAEDWWRALRDPMEENFRHLTGDGLDARRVDSIAAAARTGFEAQRDCFEVRRAAGRIVDGHGDVHLQHVWFETGPGDPILIDCLEFGAALRRIDVASEVSFLSMDLAYRGQPALAERFLRTYAAETDDFGLYSVVDWFASYRAAVRAKVAHLAAQDPAIEAGQRDAAATSARRHLDLAEACLEPGTGGCLVLLCGVVGTGKSSVASSLADAVGGVVLSSDRTRKHRAGLAPEERGASDPGSPGTGLYAAAETEAVYAALLERAEAVVASGRPALLDATYARRDQRGAAAGWATARGVPSHLVEVRCDPALTRRRLARRRAAGHDPSDAGPELLDWSLRRFEAPGEWPAATRHLVETDTEGWRQSVDRIAALLPASWHRTCKDSRKDPGVRNQE